MPLPYLPPDKAPQPIREGRSRANVWLIIIAITFIAVLFILYVFVWQESIAAKRINNVALQSKNVIVDLTHESQDKFQELQTEINTLKNQINKREYCENGYTFDQCLEKNTNIVGMLNEKSQAHPPIQLLTETHYEYHYLDTGFGQIQLLKGDRIDCPDQISVTGTLHKILPETENDLTGYYMMVTKYECLK